ncbi:MAG: hypothetical protein KBD00_00295 [Candidatus Peribacteraceae bacterium]|nr:hypothetical protein [Candidatus Peribacteraceae bacterium]
MIQTVSLSKPHRIGVYYWAGPGTIRMIKQKFFSPRIDEEAFLRAYDVDVLSQYKEKLGITDAWISYSWGFSDDQEQEDRQFLRERLENFKQLGIATHAYVQGTNLVYASHRDTDYYCRDHRGSLIPYHKGRRLCCINNPQFRRLLAGRVQAACFENVDGVFLDNFHFGQFPIPVGKYTTFFGCYCDYCQKNFAEYCGLSIPLLHDLRDLSTQHYIDFRVECMKQLSEELSSIAHRAGKQFGVNGLDANLDTQLFYGYNIADLDRNHDYLLIENFNHPFVRGNDALSPIIASAAKSVFIVSYKNVIGRHAMFSQRDVDAVYTESRNLGYFPCYKASEFTTKKLWQPLLISHLEKPQRLASRVQLYPKKKRKKKVQQSRWRSRLLVRGINRIDVPFLQRSYERRVFHVLTSWIVDAGTVRGLPSYMRMKSALARKYRRNDK